MFNPKFDLGEVVKDNITGYTGYITAIIFSIGNDISYQVERDGAGCWFTEVRLRSHTITIN